MAPALAHRPVAPTPSLTARPKGTGMAKQLRGVVIRVRDLDAVAQRYERILGTAPVRLPDECFSMPGQVAGIRFDLGGSFVQFVAPVGDDSPLRAALDKLGEGLSQISFWVDDVDAEMARLQGEDVRFTDDAPRDLPLGRVLFGHPKSLNGVMWELEEHPDVFA
jgi:methylmalonyl-CoA/ethylmalonyl-CoA epimerase